MNNVTGDFRVFRKDYNGRALYSTTIGKKDKDGNWENEVLGLQFMKGVDIADKTDIEVKSGWLTFYKAKDGTVKWGIFVKEYSTGEEQPEDNSVEDEIPF